MPIVDLQPNVDSFETERGLRLPCFFTRGWRVPLDDEDPAFSSWRRL